ncbi:MAG: DEAD/DEAH box helicase family protein [Planctomycetia bacterium]|nr:DEAD/DEAH box helicase family protein [Planctomycetia bacterium]
MPKRAFKPDPLIINSPFEEPKKFWSYDRQHRIFTETEGRRPAGYLVASPGAKGFDDPGQFVELPLVNRIRPLVKRWAEANYPGATGVTRRLLEHWRDAEQREGKRFFFCQLEAVETLIWLTEGPAEEREAIAVPGDGGPFPRWCTKLATGTGKTVVMAMLIAWQVLSRVTYGERDGFSKNILVIAPGLTVKSRLSVLVPDAPGDYYDEFQILPPGLHELLRQGKVLVHNWHKLDWESDEQLARRRSVDKRGAKSDEAYARDVLGEMAAARDLLVINDEAHHAWRVPPGSTVRGLRKEDVDEATKWIGGLDRIHAARKIMRCFDFSATPFVPSGRASSEEALFGWIVSDFGLNDAVESGLVKTPRVVVRDDSRLGKDFRSRLYHIYSHHEVKDDLNRKAQEQEPLPDLVRNGYALLGQDWQETARQWKKEGAPTPPVMITVANRTETAARVKYAFDHGRIPIEELCDAQRTLHIDSKVLESAESREEPTALSATGDDDADGDDDGDAEAPAKKLTRQEQAERLRQIVDTVGRPGQPGEQIQNVISVGMLSEGWDAKTVTHIMGLRAFSSQLLCEQVVGRGLRRTSYDINPESEMFDAEYVNIFGVPFTFLPHEEKSGAPPPPPKPKTLVEPMRSREEEFGISWPNVLRIERAYAPRLSLDLDDVPVLTLDAFDAATQVELAPMLEGKPNIDKLSEIDLAELARKMRMQKIVFEVARDVFDQMQPTWSGAKDALLAQVIRIVESVLRSDRIVVTPPLFQRDEVRRRIVLALKMGKIVQHIWQAIRYENTARLELVFDAQRPVMSTGDMRPWYTGRPCELTRRSHVNVCTFDSRWEASEAFHLDRNKLVDAWVKNDHLGFEVLYVFGGVVRKYRPDFLMSDTSFTPPDVPEILQRNLQS